jgi:hypothetical protein
MSRTAPSFCSGAELFAAAGFFREDGGNGLCRHLNRARVRSAAGRG